MPAKKKKKNIQIVFKKLSKEYSNGTKALTNISFEVEEGEFLFIIGKSGAGKSTVLRMLTKEELPTDGTVMFEEIDVPTIPRSLLPMYRQQLGIVFQDLKLLEGKTVEENIKFALEIANVKESEIAETTAELLDLVNLSDKGGLFPKALSGGERQRVAIARALANNPKVLIADEPTGNLDPMTSVDIMKILKKINGWGTTIIVITHDKQVVDKMKMRVLELEKGKIVRDGVGRYVDSKKK